MRKLNAGAVEVAIGYAAGPAGGGVAYARLGGAGAHEVIRLPFRISGLCSVLDRAAAYAAVVVTAKALRKRGVTRARFVMPDAGVVEELRMRGVVPQMLVLAYVRLRCALNAFDDVAITSGATDELMQRARAEVALNLAA
jgi:hypothetical protein